MKQIKTITANEMRGINRTAILELIRSEGPISRTYISKKLNVSLPTVMRIVDELTAEKIVIDQDNKEWSGGRKRSLITLNYKEHITVGLDMGGSKIYGAVTNLGGEVLFEKQYEKDNTSGEEIYNLLLEPIDELLLEARETKKNILGIGIGVPGVTYHDTGVVIWAPSLNWRDFPLKDRLMEKYSLPIIVDNDVNLAALGEMWFGAGKDVQDLVTVYIGTGIGAGVVIDGALYRGAHQAAGEIGYLLPGREFLKNSYPKFGALEKMAAGTGMIKRAMKYLKEHKDKKVNEGISAEDIFNAHRRGEIWASHIVEEVLDYLAILIAAVISFYDPEVIVISGGVVNSADLIIGPICKRIEGKLPHIPSIISSSLGHRATVMGAMINLIHNVTDFYVVRKLS